MGQFDAVFGNAGVTPHVPEGRRGSRGERRAGRVPQERRHERSRRHVPASIVPIEQEPGTAQGHEWAGYDTKWLYADYLKAGYPEPKFSFLVNTEGAMAKTAAGFEWDVSHPENGYVQDYLKMGAIQPWDTSQIPNFAAAEPGAQAAGQVDGKQYEIALDWGYSAPLIRADMLDPNLDSYEYLFTDEAQGKSRGSTRRGSSRWPRSSRAWSRTTRST